MARQHDHTSERIFSQLRKLVATEHEQAFAIGDLVNRLKDEYGLTVKEIAARIGASRQRLSELRRTAAAFGTGERRKGVDFHFFTVSARAARRLGIRPAKALEVVLKKRIGSTREATAYLAQKIRQREARRAAGQARRTLVVSDDLVGQCHREDFRKVLPRLPDGGVKLIAADPPYGQYGRFRDGRHMTVSTTRRDCDGLADAEARRLVEDLLGITRPKIKRGGCLILFRPGGIADPVWLLEAIEQCGWTCDRAVTFDKGLTKLGKGDEAYTTATERLLILARPGDRLRNHDGSNRSDIIRIAPIRLNYATGGTHHLFEKPAELCRRLICKHTYEGELIVEPFGGSAAFSCAAVQLNRRWLCCETNHRNHRFACERIAQSQRILRQSTG